MTLRTITLALALAAMQALYPVPERVRDCVTGPRSYSLVTSTFAGRACTRRDGDRWYAGYSDHTPVVRWTR